MKKELINEEVRRLQELAGIPQQEAIEQQEDKIDEFITPGAGSQLGHSMYKFGEMIYQICIANGINPIFGVAIAVIGTLGTGFAIGGAVMTMLGWGDIVEKVKTMYSDWKARQQVSPEQIKKVGEEFLMKVNSIKDPGRRKYFMGLLNKMKRTDPTDKQAIVDVQKDIVRYAKAYVKDDKALAEELKRLQELAGIKTENKDLSNYIQMDDQGQDFYIDLEDFETGEQVAEVGEEIEFTYNGEQYRGRITDEEAGRGSGMFRIDLGLAHTNPI